MAAEAAPTTPPTASTAAREVWLGEIPAVFALARDEVTTMTAPLPFHTCLPRQSLLPFVTEAVRKHFLPFAPPIIGDSQMWFEHAGDALRWQLPIGVLYDLLVGDRGEERLPWEITVHFQQFPSGTLLRSSPQDAEQLLLNALKESCYLQCGSALPVMSLPPEVQRQLADALASGSYDTFAPVGEQLRKGTLAQLGGGEAKPRAVPLRVCVGQTSWRQTAVPPVVAPSKEPSRLSDALAQLMPDHFGASAGAGADASSSAAGDDEAAPDERVLVQGVHVPLHTPLAWLAEACSHPDGFLYVCCRVGTKPS